MAGQMWKCKVITNHHELPLFLDQVQKFGTVKGILKYPDRLYILYVETTPQIPK